MSNFEFATGTLTITRRLSRREGEKQKEMEGGPLQETQEWQKWLEDLSKGTISHELEVITLKGMQVVHGQKGLVCCNLVIPDCVSDKDGNWHVGAITTLIDTVGAAAIFSSTGQLKASVDFNISYYSTAKIQEEVEIEAKVIGHKGRLSSVVVEIRRKNNGELIALGKQWMSSINIVPSHLSKI